MNSDLWQCIHLVAEESGTHTGESISPTSICVLPPVTNNYITLNSDLWQCIHLVAEESGTHTGESISPTSICVLPPENK